MDCQQKLQICHDKYMERLLPADCKTATALPAATPPPLAIAAADIILAAMEPAAIPAEVKPAAPRAKGAPTTATTANGKTES